MTNHFSKAAGIAVSIAMIGATASLALSPSSAFAEPTPAPQSYHEFEFEFSFQPSEIDSEESAQALLARLETSVRRYCSVPTRITDADRKFAEQCVTKTMTETVKKIGSSTVAAAYDDRNAG